MVFREPNFKYKGENIFHFKINLFDIKMILMFEFAALVCMMLIFNLSFM